jgi:hypothetical protein
VAPEGVVGVAEALQDVRLEVVVPDLAEQGECAPVVVEGLGQAEGRTECRNARP